MDLRLTCASAAQTGESYGGRYLPLFGAAIVDGNGYAAARNVTPINLKSIAIGNGWTSSIDMCTPLAAVQTCAAPPVPDDLSFRNALPDPGYYEQMCTKASGVGPIQSVAECARIQAIMPRCLEMFQKSCRDRFDMLSCANAVNFCSEITIFSFRDIKPTRNWYDISEICPDDG
jgi:carboxypeptidase C (cathepsin A)